jgi:mRNA-degrading endonuclease toxin of MazEF toxin-antitoxin module
MGMKQGDIFLIDFGLYSVGHEYQKRRPGVIIESDEALIKTSLITVIPLTSKLKNIKNGDIIVRKNKQNFLAGDSLLKVENIMSFDPGRFLYKIGEVDQLILGQIKRYLVKHFGL